MITALFSTALILWRLPLLRAKTKLESPLSREATFLYNNLLLVALCLTILWGVLFPILTDLFLGQTRTIGRPYYDFFLRAFGLPLLLLMGIGPLIAWRRSSVRALAADAALADAARDRHRRRARRAGRGSSRPGLIAYTFCAFVLTTIVVELVRGTRATGSLFELVRATGAATAATSSTPRSCCSRSASPARARTRPRRTHSSARAVDDGRRHTLAYRGIERSRSATANEIAGRARRRAAATRRHAQDRRSTTTSPATPPARSGSTRTGSRAEDLYVIFDQRDGKTAPSSSRCS